jgi:pimeloyl-ACP methyl ester carboxylesterase
MSDPVSASLETVVHRGRTYRAHALAWEEGAITAYEPLLQASKPHAEAAVLIHGLADAWDVWEGTAWELAASTRVFCLDLPWSARNYRREPGPAPSVWLHRVFRWLPALRFSVVAHSFGADAMLSYLDRYGPGRLDRAVFVSPFYQPTTDRFTWSTLTYFVDHFTDVLRTGLIARDPVYERAAVTDAMAEHVRDRLGPEGWLQFFTLFAASPHLRLSTVKAPVLVIGGAGDVASRPEYATDLAQAFDEGSAIVLEASGHFPMLDAPAAFNTLVVPFLTSGAIADEETHDYRPGVPSAVC